MKNSNAVLSVLLTTAFAYAADSGLTEEALASIVHLDYSVEGEQVVIVGHKGESRGTYGEADIVAKLVLPVDSFPDVYQTAGGQSKGLKAYGICGLLQDRTSQDKGAGNKFAAMVEESTRLREEGALWSVTKERAERVAKAPKVDSFLAQAIAAVKGASLAAVTAYLEKLDKDAIATIASNDAVKAKIAELRAQAESEQLDFSDMLA